MMASGGVQQPVYAQPPPSFPQHGHSSSLNGSFPQAPQMGSFDAQSVTSTPGPTPQAPRPGSQHQHHQQQQQMSFNMNGQKPMTNGSGMMGAPDTFTAYTDHSVYPQPTFYGNGTKAPSIYSAVYSNVSVFEMEVNGVAVMRRRADSWLNATQILKVAGVDKGKRTKVLEKEITGEHEKVQGGYGKYQGTWVNYQRGREFARQYGVEQLLLPLFQHNIEGDGNMGMSQGMETPTKEQAMAAQRKRLYGDGRPMAQNASGTFFGNMSPSAAIAISTLNRTRLDSPGQLDGRRSTGPRRPSQPQAFYPQDPMFGQGASQQSMQSMTSQDSFSTNGGIMSQNASFMNYPIPDSQEPPRKRIRPSPQTSFVGNAYDGNLDLSMMEGAPTEQDMSFYSQSGQSFIMTENIAYGIDPLPHPSGQAEEQKKEHLLDLFYDATRTDYDDHPAFLRLSGDEFEMPIDESCNTALHWAATLGRTALVKKLLDKGFNMRRANSGGETALIAACRARNNLDQSSFPALLDLLGSTIEVRDSRGRTLLHHIAVSSAIRGRAPVGRYYLESLLAYCVQQGSSSQVQAPFGNPMTLTRFMQEIVNAQDKSGDTALNLAARTGTTTIIEQLLEVGADPHKPNRGHLAPVDFGVGGYGGSQMIDHNLNMLDQVAATNGSSQKSFEEAQEGLMSSIRAILSQSEADFSAEMKEKKETFDKTNAALKESGSSLAEERRRLDEVKGKVREKDELEQKVSNLQQATLKLRSELQQGETAAPIQNDVPVGNADKGLDLDGRLALVAQLFPEELGDPSTMALSQEQANVLGVLERGEVLSGRSRAYQGHNQQLEQVARTLKARSVELEERYRKMVTLCTGANPDQVDDLLDGLVQAVISEQKDNNLELGKVRKFLRMVQGSGN